MRELQTGRYKCVQKAQATSGVLTKRTHSVRCFQGAGVAATLGGPYIMHFRRPKPSHNNSAHGAQTTTAPTLLHRRHLRLRSTLTAGARLNASPCIGHADRLHSAATSHHLYTFPASGAPHPLNKLHGQKQPCLLLRGLHGRQQRDGQAEVLAGAAAEHHLLKCLGLQRRLGATQLPAAGVQVILNAGCCVRSLGAK